MVSKRKENYRDGSDEAVIIPLKLMEKGGCFSSVLSSFLMSFILEVRGHWVCVSLCALQHRHGEPFD